MRTTATVMSRLTAILAILFITNNAKAQSEFLSGSVQNKSNQPVAFATVVLLRSDSTVAWNTTTDSTGAYKVHVQESGKYMLRFSFIGYSVKYVPVEIISSATKTLPVVIMEADPAILKDVTINSLRPTITQLADKMVVSVQGTALAAGSTAYDVLARSPGVFIDAEGNIQLNGRAGVTVMLDGKLTYLSANDLRTLLMSTSAENIKNIEIITNPSAKYDAEGTSGILNINMKRNMLRGINGSVFASHLYNFHDHGYSFGGNINHRSGKWSSFLITDMNRWIGGREATFTRVFYGPQKTTYFDQTATAAHTVTGPPSIRIGTDYTINENHSVGMMVRYVTNTFDNAFLTDTWIGNAPATPSLFVDANNYTTNTHKNFTTNLHYQGKLDTLGKLITADLDYVRIRNNGSSDFLNYYDTLNTVSETGKDFLYTASLNGYDIYSAKSDLTFPMKNGGKIETGVKGSYVMSDNDSRFYFNNGALVDDPRRSNHFNFKENIYAAYLNVNHPLGKKFTVQGGLRMEHTKNTGTQITTGQVTKRNYTDLFPSVFLQHKVSDNYNVTYSYSRRLNRPNYGNLNPFRAYRDPYTYTVGNPYLRSQYGDSYSITQTFKKTYILTLTYLLNKDVIAELPTLLVDSATTVYYSGNVSNNPNYGMTAVVPIKIAKFWDIQNTIIVSYNKFTMVEAGKLQENETLFYQLQSAHTIQLPAGIRWEINSLFRGPAVSGLYKMDPWVRIDMGLKKSFFKKKIDLTVNANDIFKGQWLLFRTRINGNINDFNQYLHTRNVGVTLRYNFSKGLKVEQRKAAVVEEAGRAN